VRDTTQQIIEIVEEADASPAQLAIRELNAGVLLLSCRMALAKIWPISPLSEKGEYYLTDLVAIAVHKKQRIASISVQTEAEAIGVNNRVQLAEAESHLRERINRYWQMEGVTIIDPASTYIDATVSIGNDTIILPNNPPTRQHPQSVATAALGLIAFCRMHMSAIAVKFLPQCWKMHAWKTTYKSVRSGTSATAHTWQKVCTWVTLVK
jgi:bifunctional N-acetylglucosamine-1-phosphate-uridyltransferase/glucosamine-1-phosphate-acetyltransferase GlmU-like protein